MGVKSEEKIGVTVLGVRVLVVYWLVAGRETKRVGSIG